MECSQYSVGAYVSTRLVCGSEDWGCLWRRATSFLVQGGRTNRLWLGKPRRFGEPGPPDGHDRGEFSGMSEISCLRP
jgi:hypothetical protein